MAGAGFKTFNTGDVLTASDVNTYLMQQTVMVFADASARTTALSGVLAEGMLSYLADTNATEVYDGSSWVSVSGTGDITAVTTGANSGLAGGVTTGNADIKINFASKGQLAVGTGSGTTDFLNVGTNDYTLVADSTTATGLKWAAPASGSTFVGCSLYRTGSSQSYATNTNVIVTFNNEDYDTDGFHDNSTNNSRITIPSGKGGKYRFYYRGFVTSYSSSNYINVAFWVNGSDTLFIVNYPNTSWSEGFHQGEFITNLSAGDYVEVAVNQASGQTKNMRTDSYYYQRFYCTYLGA